jgi:hypothetical protein
MPNKPLGERKKELKRRYHITNDDFEILTRHEDPKESLAERVEDYFGVRTWLLRLPGVGLVAAVVFVTLDVHSVSNARTEVPAAFLETKVAVELWADAFKDYHGRPAPTYIFDNMQQYGVTSNTVVTVVTTGTVPLPPA